MTTTLAQLESNDVTRTMKVRDVERAGLVLSGMEDGFFKPDSQRAMAACARDVELVLLEGVGHMPIWEAPDVTADAILQLVERANR